MNKQQLASTIWQSANQMRSKIEANEYKDYILGFMFYKYLSDREISFLKGEKYSDEDIKKVTADSYFCNLLPDTIDDQVLSGIVEYELIPLLKEYWFDEPTKVKDWSSNLRSAIK